MILEQELAVAEVARRLDVSQSLLHLWKKAVLKDGSHAFPGSGHLTPQEEEIERLRAEVKAGDGAGHPKKRDGVLRPPVEVIFAWVEERTGE